VVLCEARSATAQQLLAKKNLLETPCKVSRLTHDRQGKQTRLNLPSGAFNFLELLTE
jgi:hypothetical protein